jgi:hypothetical protein
VSLSAKLPIGLFRISGDRGTVLPVSQYVGNGAVPSATVAQAQGMISVQVPRTLDEALPLLGARARTNHLSVEQVALAVIEGEVRFD